jgi:hypothetical protein
MKDFVRKDYYDQDGKFKSRCDKRVCSVCKSGEVSRVNMCERCFRKARKMIMDWGRGRGDK